MFNKLLNKLLKCGITDGTRYNISGMVTDFPNPSDQSAVLTLSGYMEIKENYYTPRPPAMGNGLPYPYVASDIDQWQWTWTASEPLVDYGNQTSFIKQGNGGTIEFHNDENDKDRPGDVFLPAWELDLTGSNNEFHTNDLAEIGGTPRYDMGISGTSPNYEITDTLIFHVDETNFLGGGHIITHVVTFTREPKRFCPLAPLWRWLYRL